ncbi:NADH dehydrogenase [ubiquinone] 1 beta subcomplex subunit 9-like [Toxorhynchites rutilus septentrionalis]|uniref:NADH dehydrogenase [ubiquinone] 1 beta subcomplex subunit 9-like n=1 Tax=Toxorhynchites rutilus septentrionalis TaxID=329112 RepID=UPI00247AD922|nr:NADH dehydrogenase [ubiquinone] 1 beta subcomplex subunit 9-like [Toxorhynchites rutilus septentrionalis]XP_055644185.1 NADH dehydrogenase [ubiquinone] 1 beta subcomplex subunit 9-like [Toxorhynchites rutilus septentrionalis]
MSTSAASPHAKRVCTLYKKAIRNLEAWYDRRHVFRYQATLMRARFDAHKNENDPTKIAQLVADGERELFETQHFQPRKFANSPGGDAFEREIVPPDWILDYWHPLEKAHFPEYFARREKRKEEYTVWWEKQYGKATIEDVDQSNEGRR